MFAYPSQENSNHYLNEYPPESNACFLLALGSCRQHKTLQLTISARLLLSMTSCCCCCCCYREVRATMPPDIFLCRRVPPRNYNYYRQHTILPRPIPPPLSIPKQSARDFVARLPLTLNSVGCTRRADRVSSREMARHASPLFANNSHN